MKRGALALLSLALIGLLIAAPSSAFSTEWTLHPGEHQSFQYEFSGPTTLRVEVNITSGSQVTMLILDQAALKLFESNQTYKATYQSTTMNHLTVTIDVEGGTWYVVLDDRGSDEVLLQVDITYGSSVGSDDLFVYLPLVVISAIAVAVVAAVYLISKRKKEKK